MNTPDYRTDGFEPASARVEDDFFTSTLSDDMHTQPAAHHTDSDSFLLFYDHSAVWGLPGMREYIGMHIQRDLDEGTFAFEHAQQPTVPLTQNWLINRGCPPEAIELKEPGPRPADALTSRLEDVLRTNPDGRYTLLEDYTHNPGNFRDGVEISTLFHDAHPDSADRPYRLFLEETAPSLQTYTVREGAFPSAEAAEEWLQERTTPLPLAPPPASNAPDRRAAALTRTTTGATAGPQLPPPAAAPAPGTNPTHSRARS